MTLLQLKRMINEITEQNPGYEYAKLMVQQDNRLVPLVDVMVGYYNEVNNERNIKNMRIVFVPMNVNDGIEQ